ncbi:hypothetical protein [Halobaculum rubrum]|uniref:hypothetical protein n=1 Tax=Halobaculum rubrum TaxID=2872158 RepID=UPI001CA403F5|nr:hypothetical protein [Halobaculum rubrum]QZX98714.1 hypothetical protein K6T25_10555 [Halobaculum rubrum]
MAQSERPAHGSGAQTIEISVDLVAHGHDRDGVPRRVDVLVSTDANGTLQVEARTGEQFDDYRIDARVKLRNIEPRRAFRGGVGVDLDELPAWVETIVDRAEARVFGE